MNTISRREFARFSLAAAAGAWLVPTFAQGEKAPGRLLVGYPPGGTIDTTARRLTDAWRRLGRPYIVDNRAGAAGRIASSQLQREKPDGRALLCTHTSALTIFPHVYTKLMYAPEDFVPVSPFVSATCAFAVSSAVPVAVKSVRDYVEWVRTTPSGAAYTSPAAGSVAHFLGYQLSEAGRLNMQHIGYRGSAPAIQDLLGGQIPAYFGFVTDFLPYLQQDRIRILAVSGERRSRFMQSVPTFTEEGFPTIRGGETYGILAPPGTPQATVEALYDSMVSASKDAAVASAFEQIGLEITTLPPPDFARLIQRERDAWGPVVRASGFRFEE